jgi:hypothetical protein
MPAAKPLLVTALIAFIVVVLYSRFSNKLPEILQ